MEDATMERTLGHMSDEEAWARGRIQAGTAKIPLGFPVKLFLRSEGRFVDAVGTGKKNKRREHVVRIVRGGRKWDVAAKPRDILVRW